MSYVWYYYLLPLHEKKKGNEKGRRNSFCLGVVAGIAYLMLSIWIIDSQMCKMGLDFAVERKRGTVILNLFLHVLCQTRREIHDTQIRYCCVSSPVAPLLCRD